MKDPFVHIKQAVYAIMKIDRSMREPCKAIFESMLLGEEAREAEQVDEINGVIAKHAQEPDSEWSDPNPMTPAA